MTREKITLDILKRIKQNQDDQTHEKKEMLESSINIIIYRTFKTLLDVYQDILLMKPLKDIFSEERRMYIGIFLILLSVCFIILYKV